jgi:hypothetical protein
MASQLGYEVNESLPLLDGDLRMRSEDSVVKRLLCLHAAAACAYGFDRQRAIAWIGRERLSESLTAEERGFIEHGHGDPNRFRVQIEAMWALAWALGIVSALEYGKPCGEGFVALLPNLKTAETTDSLRQNASLRSAAEIAASLDLAYCIHWAIRDAGIARRPARKQIQPYVIVERRRALEWLVGEDDWDDLSLDT